MPQVSIQIANRTFDLACGAGEEAPRNDGFAVGRRRSGPCQQRGGRVQDRTASAHRLAQQVARGRRVHETHAVTIHRAEQHHETREFQERLPL